MASLLDKIKNTTIQSTTLSDSMFFNNENKCIKTNVPIINAAFSGDLNGGFTTGITVLSGQSKSFKTLLGLICMKAYLDEHPEGLGVLYDCEFGVTPHYIKSIGIDPDRVVHVPLEHVEQLKFDMQKKLDAISRGDKIFFLLDSLGNLASKKEVDDARDEKSVSDMTRAKAIRSWLRTVTPTLTTKDLPLFIINHVYSTMEMYAKTVIPGGTAVTYSANQIFVITKAKEKDGSDLAGNRFTINIEKSRFVREGIKFPFVVKYGTGIDIYSGLLEFAIESGHVEKSGHRYTRPSVDGDKKWWAKDTSCAEFWNPILEETDFAVVLKEKLSFDGSMLFKKDDSDDDVDGDVELLNEEYDG